MERPPLSVVIPCKNEEKHLVPCVQAVIHWAEEVVIADSGSTDNTLSLAENLCREYPQQCRLVRREFDGFGRFKGWAVRQCRYDWVFVLDADERMTEALSREIDRELAQRDCAHAYRVGFEHHFLGYRIRYGSWNHKVVRLFRQSVGQFTEDTIHERVVVSSGRIGTLRERLKHYTYSSLDQWFRKKNLYTSLGAIELWQAGKRASLADLLLRPFARFFKSYVLRAGFLDGFGGLLVALDDAWTAYQKYLKLWELEKMGPEFIHETSATPHPHNPRFHQARLQDFPDNVVSRLD